MIYNKWQINVCTELLTIVFTMDNGGFLVFYKGVGSPYTNIIK